jgi:hypothetical protein
LGTPHSFGYDAQPTKASSFLLFRLQSLTLKIVSYHAVRTRRRPAQTMSPWFIRPMLTAVLAVAALACASTSLHPSRSSFLVTTEPVTLWNGIRSCVALDPSSTTGVWHWQPHWDAQQSNCDCRSTGPGVFAGETASIERQGSHERLVRFRLGLHSAVQPFVDVQLLLTGETLRNVMTESAVRVQPQLHLVVPECR